jgi:hypothetical protein
MFPLWPFPPALPFNCRGTLAAPTAFATSIRPSSATTSPNNYSDVTSAIAPISYDLNSAIGYDVNSAANI